MPATDFRAILRILSRHGAQFVVVGGVGAVLHGAPIHTFDLDIVHQRTGANIEAILAALRDLNARYRLQPERNLHPDTEHLLSPGGHLLITDHGPVDLLGSIAPGYGYDDLLPKSVTLSIEDGLDVQILGLSAIIESKEAAGSDKDRAVLPVLRRTLDELPPK